LLLVIVLLVVALAAGQCPCLWWWLPLVVALAAACCCCWLPWWPLIVVATWHCHVGSWLIRHKVHVLSYCPSIPPKGKVEPLLSEMELEEATAEVLELAKLELNPGQRLTITPDQEELTNLPDHDVLYL
jgi:hypothetical protein